MKTFTVTGYQPWGTRDPNAYTIDIAYRGVRVAQFSGERAGEYAMRYVAKHGGRAVISMGDR